MTAYFTKSLAAALCAALASPIPASAYEADVHFGLTRWLALRAGFTESQADAIAVGDQRVDGGSTESIELDLEYACAGHFPSVARQAQRGHYPSAQQIPASPADRVVEPGSAAARHELIDLYAASRGKEGLMLGRFGRALHPLQDSWAHQGVPATPRFGASLTCDDSVASAHPAARGGPDSHAADLTMRWPADVTAMARATYDEMTRYGKVEGQPRKPDPWAALSPLIAEFAKASTKTQKRAWFLAHGIADTNFLEGISLPDGPSPGPLKWNGRMLLPLPGLGSQQHDAPAEVRAFFDDLFAHWLGAQRTEDLVANSGPRDRNSARNERTGAMSAVELSARLKLWRLRDHGLAATLAHAPTPLTFMQQKAVDRMARIPSAYLPPMTIAEAVIPLQPSTPAPMPMLPYIVCSLAPADGMARMIAIMRLKHAPYDTLGFIAQHRGDRWVLIDIVSSVDL